MLVNKRGASVLGIAAAAADDDDDDDDEDDDDDDVRDNDVTVFQRSFSINSWCSLTSSSLRKSFAMISF